MIRPMLALLGAAALSVSLGAEDKKPAEKAKQVLKPGEKVGINPQPEPPGDRKKLVQPGETKALKPQPEPPAKQKKLKPGEEKMLNPQPEPPKEKKVKPTEAKPK